MSEGRSFEQIEEMTVHDLYMISRYRSLRPPLEDLVSLIAQSLGVYEPKSAPVRDGPLPPPPDLSAFRGTTVDGASTEWLTRPSPSAATSPL